MGRRLYRFNVEYPDGRMLEKRASRCFAAAAPEKAARLLKRSPGAAAVYAIERRGSSAYAVYAAPDVDDRQA